MPAYDATLFDPPAPLAMVTVRAPTTGVSVNNVAVLIVDGSHGILGRNAINSLSLIMDGPKLIWRATK
jgi:hypothetical protein